ncbi:hypothetical protein [Mycobacterium sp. 48b]|uniref:hypothetical protein n=1 Tax=Mycobacterium sp. 48b TaxID=3400426 RepID=UPI003AAB3956
MPASVRSYLVAGAAAATATTIALVPVQAAPADIAVPAHPTSTQPQLTQAMVDLLAAASRMTAAVAPKIADQTGAAPSSGVAPTAAVGGDVSVQNAAGDFLESAYLGIQGWVDWAVDYGTDLAYWVGQWVPFVSPITTQVDIFYWTLIKPIADAIVLTFLVPVVNDPLNLGVWINSGAAAITQSLQAAVNFGVAEFNEFFGWILPPLPPPFPTVASVTTAQTLAGPLDASALRDAIANAVQQPADFITKLASNLAPPAALTEGTPENPLGSVTEALTKAGENFASVFKKLTDGTGIETLADRLKVQADEAAETGTALIDDTVKDSAAGVDQQVKPVTDDISVIPRSVRQSLRDTVAGTAVSDAPDTAEAVESETGKTAAKTPARSVRQGVREAVAKATADTKKAGDDARDAVKTAVKNVTPKPKAKKEKTVSAKDSQQSKDSDDSGKSDKGKK